MRSIPALATKLLAVVLIHAGMESLCHSGAPATPPSLEQVLPLVADDDADAEGALLKTLARRPRGREEAVTLIRNWVAGRALTHDQERQLQILVQTLHKDEQVEQVIAETLKDPKATRQGRLLLLRMLARTWIEPPPSWLSAIGSAIEADDLAVRREAVATVRSRGLTPFDAALRDMSQQSSLPADLRIAALDAIAPRQRLSADAVALLTKQLAADADPLLRRSAARALGAARLESKQLLLLAEELPNSTPTAGMMLLPAFTRGRDATVGLALVKGLKAAPTAQLLTVGDLDRLLPYSPTPVVNAAQPLRDKLLDRSRSQREHLAKVASELPPGNRERGKGVFLSAKANCSGCHRAAGKGGTIGPNLSRIGVIRGRPDLLESIVLPSAYVAPEFRASVITTTAGGLTTGIIVQESSDAFDLRGGEGASQRIARDRIEDVELSPTSLMPEGFDRLLSRQELSDLVEFLANLR